MATFNYPQYTEPYLDTTTTTTTSYYNHEEEEEEEEKYKTALQTLYTTLHITLPFLTHLLHSFNADIQNLTYIPEDTIDHLWKAKLSTWSSTSGTSTWDRDTSRENRGLCAWVRKIRAFFTHHQHHSQRDSQGDHQRDHKRDYENRNKTTTCLSLLETNLTRAISTPWPSQGTTYAPDSVVYSDLNLDSLYDRLVVTLEYFPVSLEYRRVKEVVTALELVQIVMDRTDFLWSSTLNI